MPGFIGLETFFPSTEIRCKSDVIVAAVHWGMILAGYRCVGINSKKKGATAPDCVRSEALPEGWNNNNDLYTLKYKHENGTQYIVKIILVDNALLVNVLNSSNDVTLATSINIDSHVNDDLSSYRAYKDPGALYNHIMQHIITPLASQRTTAKENVTHPRHNTKDADNTEESHPPPESGQPVGIARPRRDYEDHPLAIGRGDLDPLGQTAGGMLMDPRGLLDPRWQQDGPRFGLPRGSIPPGARFDPFGPVGPYQPRPNPNRFSGPDPDHLPPPGYDDMFG